VPGVTPYPDPMPPAAPPAAGAVAVVVLNWNGGTDTLRCLRSLRAQEPDLHLIVVDNGSTDGSVGDVETEGLADDVIRTGENLGYAGGNNLGLQRALADGYGVIAVLNNDTYVERPVFGPLANAVVQHPELVLSPLIRYADSDDLWFEGGVIDAGYPRHVQPDELPQWQVVDNRREADVLSGCCIVATAATWRDVGVFNDGLFLLFEDSDWSLRARAAGRRLAVATDLEIRHAVSGSVRSPRTARLIAFYFGRNLIWFSRHHSPGSLPRLASQWLGRAAGRAVLGREPRDDVFFRWLGALSALVGQSGIAPRWVQRLAAL
jgi:GT2 family glycosyltransferase